MWPLKFWEITDNISEMVQDRDVVTKGLGLPLLKATDISNSSNSDDHSPIANLFV